MNKNSIVRQFMVIGFGTIINVLIGFLTTPVITRMVDPTQYGQLSMFNTYSNIFMLVLSLGLDQSFMRFFYREDDIEYKRKLLNTCCFKPVLIIVVVFIAFLACTVITGNASDKTIFLSALFVLNIVMLQINRFSLLVLRLEKKSTLYSVANITHKLSYALLTVVCLNISNHNDFYILVMTTIMSTVITTVVAIANSRGIWNVLKNKYTGSIDYKEIVYYGLPMLLANGIYMFFQAIDKISLSYFCSYAEVGVYASAMSLMSMIAIIRTTFNTIWAPASIENYEKNPEDKAFYQKGNLYITIIMFAIGITLMLSKDLIVYLLGEKYRMASEIMPFLLFQPIMYTISETTVVGVYFMKKSHAQLIISAAACIFNLVGNFILIPIVGAKGAAISTGFSYILFFTLRTWFSNRYYYIDFSLKKFYFITLLTVIYAFYNTFESFSWISVVLYIILAGVMCFIYRKTVKELILVGLKRLKK